MFAQDHARLGDAVCCAGMLASAVLCVAHARLARRREWVLNEKRLVQRAGLYEAQAVVGRAGASCDDLIRAVSALSTALQIERLRADRAPQSAVTGAPSRERQ